MNIKKKFEPPPSALKTKHHVFFTYLSNIVIHTGTTRSIELSQGLRITNDKKIIHKIVEPGYKEILGTLNFEALRSSKALVYSDETITQTVDGENYAAYKMHILRQVLLFAWMVKDHSIIADTGYVAIHDHPRCDISSTVSPIPITKADGSQSEVHFTRDELKILNLVPSYNANTFEINNPNKKSGFTHFTKDANRIDVARLHISHAMQALDIGMKVSNYCSALESLFSSETRVEMVHQIAERVACFLSHVPAERLIIYATIKKIYNSRSKFVHGDTFKPGDLDNLKQQSMYADWTLRWVLNRILGSADMLDLFDGKERESYMRELVMGGIVLKKQYNELPKI